MFFWTSWEAEPTRRKELRLPCLCLMHSLNLLPDVGFEDFIKPIIPTVSNRDFFHSLSKLGYLGVSLEPYYSTASGRPSILNGLRDFSYYSDFVLKHKEKSLVLLLDFFLIQETSISLTLMVSCAM